MTIEYHCRQPTDDYCRLVN